MPAAFVSAPIVKATEAAWARYASTCRMGGTPAERRWAYEAAKAAQERLWAAEAALATAD